MGNKHILKKPHVVGLIEALTLRGLMVEPCTGESVLIGPYELLFDDHKEWLLTSEEDFEISSDGREHCSFNENAAYIEHEILADIFSNPEARVLSRLSPLDDIQNHLNFLDQAIKDIGPENIDMQYFKDFADKLFKSKKDSEE